MASDDGDYGLTGNGLVDGYYMTMGTLQAHHRFDAISSGGGPAVDSDDVVIFHLLEMTAGEQAAYDNCEFQLDCGEACEVWQNPVCDGCPNTNPCLDPYEPNDGQCSNGWDDDGDGLVDEADMCDHNAACNPNSGWPLHQHLWEGGESVFFTGSLYYCTENGTDWDTELYSKGKDELMARFGNNTGYAGFDGLAPTRTKMRWGGSQCWVHSTLDEAEDCQQDGVACGSFASGAHYYPFIGFDHDPAPYNGAAWAAVHHASQTGLIRPVTLSQIVVDGALQDSSSSAFCGEAPEPGTVSTTGTGNCYKTTPHEIGHNLGASHCDHVCDASGCTLMGDDDEAACPAAFSNNHRHPWFSSGSASAMLPKIRSGTSPGPLQFGSGY